jgi:uncharacterized membrane protein
MKRSMMIPVVLFALVAMAIMAPTVQAKGGTRIVLNSTSAFSGAKGSAKYQAAGQRELEVELEHVRRLAGKPVSFFVNSTKIGSSRVSALGAARVDRRGSTFPAVRAGTVVKVKTAGGKTIVSGTF